MLQLDETGEKVRAIPEKRCVLILREIPKDTPKEVCMCIGIFMSAFCDDPWPAIVSKM